jgi:SAM-dependent methyltransferase
MINSGLNWTSRSIKRRGWCQTFKVAWSVLADLFFDLRHGTDTMRWMEVRELNLANAEHAVRYTASKAGPLKKLLASLDLPKNCTFVDLGCGKGRVLLIAAKFGFRRVVGVEFSPDLCRIAAENIRIFDPPGSIKVVCSDVATFPIRRDYTVFYLYNPFDRVVMQRFLANLQASLGEFPRSIWLIYNTPIHASLIVGWQSREYEFSGTKFKVYANSSVAHAAICRKFR